MTFIKQIMMKEKIKYIPLLIALLGLSITNAQESYNIDWTDIIGAKQEGNNLISTETWGWSNSGAASTGEIPENTDGWVEFTVPQMGKYMMFGLSDSNCDASYMGINYAIYTGWSNYFYVFESGNYRVYFRGYRAGDVFRVERKGSQILYKRNGKVFYANSKAVDTYLLADVSFYSPGSRLNNTKMSAEQIDKELERQKEHEALVAAKEELETKVEELEQQNENLTTAIEELESKVQDIEQKNDELVTNNTELEQEVENLNSEVQLLSEKNEDLEEQTTSLESVNTELSRSIEELKDQINTLTEETTNLQEENANLSGKIEQLEKKNSDQASHIAQLSGENSKLSSDLASANETIDDLEKENAEKANQIAQLSEENSTLKLELGAANGTISDLENETSEQATEITNLKSELEVTIGKMDDLAEENESLKSTKANLEDKLEIAEIWTRTDHSVMYDKGMVELYGTDNETLLAVHTSDTDVFKVNADGKVHAKEVNVNLSDFPDYVFEPDYDLMSLSNLEKYIEQNGHLPNIPTAQKVSNTGIGLAELSRLQMEKIEELTLYILHLNEKIKTIKNQRNEK